MMEVMLTTRAIRCAKLQSNHHCQQTNIQLFTGPMHFLSPNQQCQSTEGMIQKLILSLLFNSHSPGEPGLAGVYRRKG